MNSGDKRLTGVIKSWDDAKGYGFIELEGRRRDVFFHISAFESLRVRPEVGDEVIYILEEDVSKGPRAEAVWLRGEPVQPETGLHRAVRRGAILRLLALPIFGAYCYGLSRTLGFEPGILAWQALVSVICYYKYADDKARAMKGWRRTPEASLLIWGLIGGWPGRLLAQLICWHKSNKRTFQFLFWLSVTFSFFLTGAIGALNWQPVAGALKAALFDFHAR